MSATPTDGGRRELMAGRYLMFAGGGALAGTHVDCPAPVTSSGAFPIEVAAPVVGSNVKTSESRKS